MRKITLFLLAVLSVMGAEAKTFETTLWEDEYTDGVELNAETVATFLAGNVLRVYATVPSSGANFKIVYKGASNGWSETTIPSIDTQWPWMNGGDTYKDFTLTDADITALEGNNIYIYKGENSEITKVVLYGEVPTTGETQLLEENWTASWSAKAFAAQSGAKMGDIIQIQYTAYKDESTDWPWVQFYFMDEGEANLVEAVAASKQKGSTTTFEYEIASIDVLEKIQTGGFKIKGDQFILTSVKLLTYADSYDAVAVTIGSDCIATWSHTKDLDFTGTSLTAYYCSAYTTGSITLAPTATTWNYCGYILMGDEGTYTVPVATSASYPAATWLQGNTGSNTIEATVTKDEKTYYNYIFAKDSEGNIGFYKLTENHTLAANKAYLSVPEDIAPTGGETHAITLTFDEEDTTGIDRVQSPAAGSNVYYNLSGVRVVQPTKGLYIVNGKKVVIK